MIDTLFELFKRYANKNEDSVQLILNHDGVGGVYGSGFTLLTWDSIEEGVNTLRHLTDKHDDGIYCGYGFWDEADIEFIGGYYNTREEAEIARGQYYEALERARNDRAANKAGPFPSD